MVNKVEWRGQDGFGFHYGFYHAPGQQGPTRLDVLPPGEHNNKTGAYIAHVEGAAIGKAATLEDAKALAVKHAKEQSQGLLERLVRSVKGRGR